MRQATASAAEGLASWIKGRLRPEELHELQKKLLDAVSEKKPLRGRDWSLLIRHMADVRIDAEPAELSKREVAARVAELVGEPSIVTSLRSQDPLADDELMDEARLRQKARAAVAEAKPDMRTVVCRYLRKTAPVLQGDPYSEFAQATFKEFVPEAPIAAQLVIYGNPVPPLVQQALHTTGLAWHFREICKISGRGFTSSFSARDDYELGEHDRPAAVAGRIADRLRARLSREMFDLVRSYLLPKGAVPTWMCSSADHSLLLRRLADRIVAAGSDPPTVEEAAEQVLAEAGEGASLELRTLAGYYGPERERLGREARLRAEWLALPAGTERKHKLWAYTEMIVDELKSSPGSQFARHTIEQWGNPPDLAAELQVARDPLTVLRQKLGLTFSRQASQALSEKMRAQRGDGPSRGKPTERRRAID